MEPLFPLDAPIRHLAGDSTLLLGAGRALLMQVAHPSVAAGVSQHSDFAADPFGRLFRTLEATYGIVFGTEEEARAIARSVTAVHQTVTGPGYAATDPELLLWVHATLVDTTLVVHERFLGPLVPHRAERFYQDSKVVAELYGCPADSQPADLAEFRSYVDHMVQTIQVSAVGRDLARSVLHARLPWPAPLALPLARELTVGLLPRPLREQLGFTWGRNRKRALIAAQLAARTVLPRVPAAVRRAPVSLLARAA